MSQKTKGKCGQNEVKIFMQKSNDHKDYILESKLKLFSGDLKEKSINVEIQIFM